MNETKKKSSSLRSLRSLAGTDLVLIKTWHITLFIFLFAFLVLFVFFYTFQPQTLLGNRDWLYYAGESGGVRKTNTSSENNITNKWLSDQGRIVVFVWSIGLGAAVALFFHLIMVFT